MINTIGLQTFVWKEVQRFLRIYIQTLLSPWINAVLYIFIFGYVVGSRIDTIGGVSYIQFVIPGIIMMNVLSSAFAQTSSSLYFQRFAKHIEEVLIAPLANWEIIFGYVVGGVVRALLTGTGIYALAVIFGAAEVVHIWWFLFYAVSVSLIFSFLGLIIGLWADNFEQLAVLNTFVITPLTFLGGMFNSITMLPEQVQSYVRLNPFFYFVDGFRFAMTGIQESNQMIGLIMILILLFSLGGWVWYLFSVGWRIRN